MRTFRFMMIGLICGCFLAGGVQADDECGIDVPNMVKPENGVPYFTYLKAAEAFAACAPKMKRADGPFDPTVHALHHLAWALSFVGDVEGAGAVFGARFDDPLPAPPKDLDLDMGMLTAHGAIARIREAALGRQIVILNEAHHWPEHRAFARRLAGALFEDGFTHLAVEALLPNVEADDWEANRVVPGFYVAEPTFYDFVRSSLYQGYKLVSYDYGARAHRGDACQGLCPREKAQATNLVRKVFKRDPDARLLIYAGYDHLSEDQDKGWMAARLEAMTGIDPLTIDQVGGTLQADGSPDATALAVHAGDPIRKPMVFARTDGSFLRSQRYEGRVDMTVFHPRHDLLEGRPSWLAASPGARTSKTVAVPAGEGRRLVQIIRTASLPSGYASPVPIDQLLVGPEAIQVTLYVPADGYRVLLVDEAGKVTLLREFAVIAE